jgi:hypothetical protein
VPEPQNSQLTSTSEVATINVDKYYVGTSFKYIYRNVLSHLDEMI